MNFFFFFYDSPFYWVRAGVLESAVARKLKFGVSLIVRSNELHDSPLLVFNRFGINAFFSFIMKECVSYNVPFVFDLDDIFWELPGFSQEKGNDFSPTEASIRLATVISVPTDELKRAVEKRYPGKLVRVIPNATLASVAMPGGGILANTDAFKLDVTATTAFRNVCREQTVRGVPLYIMGENDNFIEGIDDLKFAIGGRIGYHDYVRILLLNRHRFGLIPVADNEYSSCKSEIKPLEFIQAGLKVFASDIPPYRRLATNLGADYKHNLTLVKNDASSWEKAFHKMLSLTPVEEVERLGKAVQIGFDYRRRQLLGWRDLYEEVLGSRKEEVLKLGYKKLNDSIKRRQKLQRILARVRRYLP
jgi:hypothetical protein